VRFVTYSVTQRWPGRSPVRSHGATPYPYPCPLDRYLQAADRGRTPDPL